MTFYFFTYLTLALYGVVEYAICKKIDGKPVEKVEPKKILFTALGLGTCLALCLIPQSYLPNYVNATVQFGVTASGALIFSLMIGWIKYKEKFDIKCAISLVSCILAIILQVI